MLLAGDCAHLMAPFGARGLNSGVADAENAAWKIAFVAARLGRPEALLESYHAERHAAARENLAVTTRDHGLPGARRPRRGRAHRRDVLERAVTDPAARAQIDSGQLYAPFRYGDDPNPMVGALHPDHARPRGRPGWPAASSSPTTIWLSDPTATLLAGLHE